MTKSQGQSANPELFYDVFKASPVGIAVESLEGQPLFVNPALCSMLGFSEEELLAKHCVDFSPAEDAEKDWALFQQLRAGSIDHYKIEKRYFKRDGSLIWGRLSISLLNRGRSPLVVALVEDVTERRQADEALQQSEKSLVWRLGLEKVLSDLSAKFIDLPANEINAHIAAGLARIGNFLEMSRITIFEFSQDGTELHPISAWHAPGISKAPPTMSASDLPWWKKQILSGKVSVMSRLEDLPEEASVEKEYFRQRGVQSAASIPLTVSREITGAMTFVCVTHQVSWAQDLVSQLKVIGDIFCNALKRKRATDALRLSEEKFSKAFQESPLAVMITRARDHRYMNVNEAFERMTGWGSDEVIGRTPFDIGVLVDARQRTSFVEKLHSGNKVRNLEVDFRTRNGEVRTALQSAELIRIEGEPCVLVVATDVTDLKRANTALQESETRFRLVANTAPVMIWMAGADKLCNYCNQSWLDFVGRPLEAELGNGWAEGVHPEDLARLVETYTEAFDRAEPFQVEYRFRRHDGEYRWVLGSGVPRLNTDGSFAGYIGSCIDITDRKLAADMFSSLSQRLLEAQEEERAWIARELHDDVNQRVALMAISLDALNNDVTGSGKVKNQIAVIAEQLKELGVDIQALSHRLHNSKLEQLGLKAAAASFCREFSEAQHVQVDFQAENVPTEVSEEISITLFRILQEALQNAIKHSGSRRFQVTLSAKPDEIELTVRDSGVGFTPGAAREGKGIGLLSMQERLKLVEGRLSVDSLPRQGTTIKASVPLPPRAKSMGAT